MSYEGYVLLTWLWSADVDLITWWRGRLQGLSTVRVPPILHRDALAIVFIVVGALLYFLSLQDAPGSSDISCSGLELAIFPRSLGSFYWRMVLETEIWVQGCSLLLGPLS